MPNEEFNIDEAFERYANFKSMADELYQKAREAQAEIEWHASSLGISRYKANGYQLRKKQTYKLLDAEAAAERYPDLLRMKLEPDARKIRSVVDGMGVQAYEQFAGVIEVVDSYEIAKDTTKTEQVKI